MPVRLSILALAVAICTLWPQGIVLCVAEQGHVELEPGGAPCCPDESQDEHDDCADCRDYESPELAAVNPDWRFVLVAGYAGAGRIEEALEVLADMEREDYPKFGIWIYPMLGDKDEALRALDAAFDYHHIFLPWVMRDSEWREDPRWQEMRRRLNFPPD